VNIGSAAVRVGLLGSQGRMGQLVTSLLHTEFSGKAALAASATRGQSLQPLLDCEVVIDFSLPQAMLLLARDALERPDPLPALVVGSTGWKLDDRRVLEELAQRTPVLMASNFSTGVMALVDILKQAAPLLDKLGYKPSIVETHHVHKKDAPSGTALSLQRAIAPGGPGNVPIQSIREGEVIGDHEVTFQGKADRITFGHFAQDRSIFARGAIQAAIWLSGQRGHPSSGRLIGIEKYFEELKKASSAKNDATY
jgi:4-hydroxy-tetrahydrodipicolinate reductase